VHAVVVCVPNALHAEVASAALRAGKHVYLEKPLATNLEDARQVCRIWQQSGLVGMMGFNYRFNPLYQAAKKSIACGRLGQIVAARSVFTTAPHYLPDWKRSPTEGGVLLDLASHEIDLARFLLGQEVASVFAEVRSLHSPGDSATLHLQMADGVPVQVLVSLCAVEEAGFEAYGSSGQVALNRYRSLAVTVNGPRIGGRFRQIWDRLQALRSLPHLLHKLRAPAQEPSYAAALAYFVGAVRGEHRGSPDFLEGYRSLAVIEAARESTRTNRAVPLAAVGALESVNQDHAEDGELAAKGSVSQLSRNLHLETLLI
jgi:myo-inositol 2-dehydrogenase/D-chiro-inositol 1-dehydrogenase